jgi:hypothetical protein
LVRLLDTRQDKCTENFYRKNWKSRPLDRQRNYILIKNRLSGNGLDILAWDEYECQGAVNTIIVLPVPYKTQSYLAAISDRIVHHTDR